MEPFIGMIQAFGYNFDTRGWASCNGQLLAISAHDALFSLLGTTYGGDGRTTFGLPDLRGRYPMGAGSGPGLSPRPLGQKSGVENVTLTVGQIPSHSHVVLTSSSDENNAPDNGLFDHNNNQGYSTSTSFTQMAGNSITNSGGNGAHHNMAPFTTINWGIALVGIYPSRS